MMSYTWWHHNLYAMGKIFRLLRFGSWEARLTLFTCAFQLEISSSMDISISGLKVLELFELKGNFTDSTVWNTGESGDMDKVPKLRHFIIFLKKKELQKSCTDYFCVYLVKKDRIIIPIWYFWSYKLRLGIHSNRESFGPSTIWMLPPCHFS